MNLKVETGYSLAFSLNFLVEETGPNGVSNFIRHLSKSDFENVTSLNALHVIYSYSWS